MANKNIALGVLKDGGSYYFYSNAVAEKGFIVNPSLLIGECGKCGYHFSVDATYVDQSGDFTFKCPNPTCNNEINTAEVFPE